MNAKFLIGLALALLIGLACHAFGVPLPAPMALIGALLVLATIGCDVIGWSRITSRLPRWSNAVDRPVSASRRKRDDHVLGRHHRGAADRAGCRLLDIPSPAPPKLRGALLVVAMTAGNLAGALLLG